jgi:hypothetical protein
MQLVDRIEKRRFVGREFLLWLWFESEVFDATLSTHAHGSFGLWLDKRLSLSAGKESTRIVSVAPGQTRQAKAALRAGQLPESAGIRIAWRDDETGFMLKAERLAVGGLKLRPPGDADAEESNALLEMAQARRKPSKPGKGAGKGAGKGKGRERDDEAHEAFYERMQQTEEFEGILEALYGDFKTLRLSPTWDSMVVPLLRVWAQGEEPDTTEYANLRYPERSSTFESQRVPSAASKRADLEAAAELSVDALELPDDDAEAEPAPGAANESAAELTV